MASCTLSSGLALGNIGFKHAASFSFPRDNCSNGASCSAPDSCKPSGASSVNGRDQGRDNGEDFFFASRSPSASLSRFGPNRIEDAWRQSTEGVCVSSHHSSRQTRHFGMLCNHIRWKASENYCRRRTCFSSSKNHETTNAGCVGLESLTWSFEDSLARTDGVDTALSRFELDISCGHGPRVSWPRVDKGAETRRGRDSGVPVYVMLPLDTVTLSNTISRPRAIAASLTALKSAGVEGVMMDVWWGIVEERGPGQYDWSAYTALVQLIRDAGLKLQAVMSFHKCGGNVGDHVEISLPPWVVGAMDKNPDLAYTDMSGGRNYEYISLGCDTQRVLFGRSPIEVYSDFMRSFRNTFWEFLGSTITEIQVGMGPAGELRYPSYPESNNLWMFPGIGEFQCYDKYMLASLQEAAESAGEPMWGYGGPHDAGTYCQWPEETGFFPNNGSWKSEYGQFFLQWYSGLLLSHGDLVLSAATSVFNGTGARVSGKVAGIHWHYWTHSHAAELTAGYYNTVNRDGYLPIAALFAKHDAVLNFTCFEMRDEEQPWGAACSPEGLLRQVVGAAKQAGARVAGENALPRFDESAQEQIMYQSRLQFENCVMDEPMVAFTFLRMSEYLFRPESWTKFVVFVRNMQQGRKTEVWEEEIHQAVHAKVKKSVMLRGAAAELMLQ